ncbi:MAG: hypothetical protein ABJE66_17535 [Deltaproteobacteria bacterium]
MRNAIAMLVLGMAATASAQPSLVAHAPESWTAETGTIGVMTDVGVPDGGTASLVVRPLRALRLEGGMAHNVVSPGVRGSVTWIPFGTWATPILSVGYGRFFERDANGIVQKISGDSTLSSPLLDKVGYDFANARIGIELGKKYFTFFLHAGVSRVTGTVHNLDQVAATETANSMVSVTTTDPEITLWGVSANLGFIFYVH